MTHLENHCNQVQCGLDASRRSHQQAEVAYGELYGKAESCYADLTLTRKAYDKAESFLQLQVQSNANQSSLVNAEIARLIAHNRQPTDANQELSESKQSQPSSSYEVVPGEKL